jgi:Family of unknown function (DUF5681)
MTDRETPEVTKEPGAFDLPRVGYCRPPLHSRFQPGKSGNPSGRAKGSKNLKSLFDKILAEEISLREGAVIRKVSKAEAVLRGLVVSALKGEPKSIVTLFRLAEQTGQFEDPNHAIAGITRVIVETGVARRENVVPFPADKDFNRDDSE